MEKSEKTIRIGKVVIGISVIAMVAKSIGFAEKIIVAKYFGTSDSADVYFAVNGIFLSIVFLVKELLYPSLLPVLVKTENHKVAYWALAKKTMVYVSILLIIICLGFICFSRFSVNMFMPGFTGDKFASTALLLRYISPAIFFAAIAVVFQIILQSRKLFIKSAILDLVFKLTIVLSILLLAPLLGIFSLAGAMILASVTIFILCIRYITDFEQIFKVSIFSDHGQFSNLLRLTSPIAVGVIFSHISSIVDNMLASTLSTGSLSYLGYSKKIMDALMLMGPVAIVTVVYSHLSGFAAEKDFADFKKLFVRTFRLLLYISIPVTFIILLFSKPIVEILFHRGNFGSGSVADVSNTLVLYSFGYIFLSLESLAVYSFYAIKDTRTPTVFGIIFVVADIILAIIFLEHFGHLAIAGAFVISKTLKVLVLIVKLNLRMSFAEKDLFIFAIKIATVNLAAGGGIMVFKNYLDHFLNIPLEISTVFLSVVFFLMIAMGSYLFGIDEFKKILNVVIHRLTISKQLRGNV